MTLRHLPRTATVEQAASALREHGCVIIDEILPKDTMDRLDSELEPLIEATAFGAIPELGLRTRRTGALIARSPTVREVVMNDLVLGIAKDILARASAVQLNLTEVISLSPGAQAQFIHRDELLYDAFPFPNDYEIYCNTLWALTESTEEMGATRVVPGSHKLGPDEKFGPGDTVPAEMARGSVLVFSGKLYHGGGENRSDRQRRLIDLGYAVSWVRQEENQYLSCPSEIARTLPEDLLRLMGYRSDHGYGHPGDRNTDPIQLLIRADPGGEPRRPAAL